MVEGRFLGKDHYSLVPVNLPSKHQSKVFTEENQQRPRVLKVSGITERTSFSLQTYLNDPSSRYNLDVDFSDDGKKILGARFVIQGARIYNANMEKQFVEELRSV